MYGLTPDQIAEFSERGRKMAAMAIRDNPAKRLEVELACIVQFGEESGKAYFRSRYPEAFGKSLIRKD